MKINNPDKKIAFIGAGPAGILAGLTLQDAGYRDLTIFGKFEEAQCRTLEIDGVIADVGTCYVHSGYFNSTDFKQAIQPSTAEKVLNYAGLLYYLLHNLVWKFLKHTHLGSVLYGRSFEQYLRRAGWAPSEGSARPGQAQYLVQRRHVEPLGCRFDL